MHTEQTSKVIFCMEARRKTPFASLINPELNKPQFLPQTNNMQTITWVKPGETNYLVVTQTISPPDSAEPNYCFTSEAVMKNSAYPLDLIALYRLTRATNALKQITELKLPEGSPKEWKNNYRGSLHDSYPGHLPGSFYELMRYTGERSVFKKGRLRFQFGFCDKIGFGKNYNLFVMWQSLVGNIVSTEFPHARPLIDSETFLQISRSVPTSGELNEAIATLDDLRITIDTRSIIREVKTGRL